MIGIRPLLVSGLGSALILIGSLGLGDAQTKTRATVRGTVTNSQHGAVAGAVIQLETDHQQSTPLKCETDSAGNFEFAAVAPGKYTLHASSKESGETTAGPFALAAGERKEFHLILHSSASAQLQFFDEPQFTVAGVTQNGAAGGHGSDTVLRTTEALARATSSLANNKASETSADEERSLRDALSRNPQSADLHHRLADLDEQQSNPLEAVHEYQIAAKLDPSERNVFDWGAELLAHRGIDAAVQVFQHGATQYPKSMRMQLGLGAAFFARGSYDDAAKAVISASELDPKDPTPYLFLGKIQSAMPSNSEQFVGRFAQFAKMQPDNALAHYYYAVSLTKQNHNNPASDEAIKLLQQSIRLDPAMSDAHLQLGILYSQQGKLQDAVTEELAAARSAPESPEPHYRLALLYRQMGEKEKSADEFNVYKELSKKDTEAIDQARRDMQKFVITMRDSNSQ